MTSAPKYNLKNPGVKRIMQEARELANESTYDYDAHPLEDNIFEWHFTVRGPKDTDFEEGRYHGRIILPNEYPFKPPEIIFLTPNGRFELNTKICLSITGFHPEFWQPAWGIRTVLLAVAGFFPTEARGAIGGLDYTKEERRRLAKKSIGWVCPVCEVNTKDALSDIPPDANAKKEELPDFMISYKPEITVDKAAESVRNSNSEEGSEQGSLTNTRAQIEKQVEGSNFTDDSVAQIVGLSSSGSSNSIDKDVGEGSKSSNQIPVKSDTEQTVMQEEQIVLPAVQNSNTDARSEQARSPLWLDALIGGLISVLLGLVVRKFVL